MNIMTTSIGRVGIAVALMAGLASAQSAEMRKKLEKQMEEISRLMRDSERRLLELTKVDRIASQQTEIVKRLEELLPDAKQPPEQAAKAAKQKEELEKKQGELQRKLADLLDGQKNAGEMSVQELRNLLRNLPRNQQQSNQQGEGEKQKQQRREREKKLRDRQREKEQRDKQNQGAKKQESKSAANKDKQQRGGKKPRDDREQTARLKRIKAWITRLPPEEQARINRNDFSSIPMRYRRLVREYTALRAKREAEKADEDR